MKKLCYNRWLYGALLCLIWAGTWAKPGRPFGMSASGVKIGYTASGTKVSPANAISTTTALGTYNPRARVTFDDVEFTLYEDALNGSRDSSLANTGKLFYNIHPVGQAAGTFTQLALPNDYTFNKGNNAYDRRYRKTGMNIALFNATTAAGNYVMEFYMTVDYRSTPTAGGSATTKTIRVPVTNTYNLTFSVTAPGCFFDTMSQKLLLCNDNGTDNTTTDDYYTSDVTLKFFTKPTTGTLSLSGCASCPSVAVGSTDTDSTHTFRNVRVAADGVTSKTLTAFFSANTSCAKSLVISYNFRSCSAPVNNSLYPRFQVSGAQILKKTSATDAGTPVHLFGTNLSGPNWNWRDNSTIARNDSVAIADKWKFNIVRFANYVRNPNFGTAWDQSFQDKQDADIATYTRKGVVSMLEVHEGTGWFPNATQMQYIKAWWAQQARKYRNNPYVWFNLLNEPAFTGNNDRYDTLSTIRNNWRSLHKQLIDTIRAQGCENVLIVDAVNFANDTKDYETFFGPDAYKKDFVTDNSSSVLLDGPTVLSYDPKRNLAFGIHAYTVWTAPEVFADYYNKLKTKGLALIVGEYGSVRRVYNDVFPPWRVGWGARGSWEIIKFWRNTPDFPAVIGWHWQGADAFNYTYPTSGRDVNSTLVNGEWTRPTNMLPEGAWAWDATHNSPFNAFRPIPATGSTRLQFEDAQGWQSFAWNDPQVVNTWDAGSGTHDLYSKEAMDNNTFTEDDKGWVEYDLNVASAGTYRFALRGFNKSPQLVKWEIRNASQAVLGTLYQQESINADSTFWSSAVSLPAGNQIIRLVRATTAPGAQFTYVDLAANANETTAPTAPGSPTVWARTHNAATIRWTASTDNVRVAYYQVLNGSTVLATVGTPYALITGLTANTAYSLTVKAFDVNGNASANSAAVAFTTKRFRIISQIDDKTVGTGVGQVSYSAQATNGEAKDGFQQANNAGAYGGTETYSTQNNATITIRFNGVQARVWGSVKNNHGIMTASLDGTALDIPVNFFRVGLKGQSQQFLWTSPDVAAGDHTLVLTCKGSYMAFDKLDADTGSDDTQAPTAPGNARLFYRTDKRTAIQWNASTDNSGIKDYEVLKDGSPLGRTTNTYLTYDWSAGESAATFTVRAYDVGDLVSGASNAVVVNKPNATASITTIQNTVSTSLAAGELNKVYFSARATSDAATNGWKDVAVANVPNDPTYNETYTGQTGASLTIKFNGIQARLHGNRAAGQGKLTSVLDGSTTYTVPADFGAGSEGRGAFTWATPELAAGDHTITFTNTGGYTGFDRLDVVTAPLTSAANSASCAANGNGQVVWERWAVASGTLANIPVTTTPAESRTLTTLEGPSNVGDNLGVRVRGYIIPCYTGNHTFYVASDQNSQFYLSTSSNPSSKSLVASVTGTTTPREWTKYASQASSPRSLTAGVRYYFEVLMGDDTGNDNLAVGWKTPNNTDITVIGGANIGSFDQSAPVANGIYEILNGRSQAMDIRSSSTLEGATIQQYFNNSTNAQKFTVTLVSAPWYRITNNNSNRSVTLSSDITSTTTVVQKTFVAGNDSFLWKFEPIGTTSFYQIVNKRSGLVMSTQSTTAVADPTGDGVALAQRTYNTTTTENGQRWRFKSSARMAASEPGVTESDLPTVYPNPTRTGEFQVRYGQPIERMSLHTATGETIGIDWQTTGDPDTYQVRTRQRLTLGLYILKVNDHHSVKVIAAD